MRVCLEILSLFVFVCLFAPFLFSFVYVCLHVRVFVCMCLRFTMQEYNKLYNRILSLVSLIKGQFARRSVSLW